MFKLFSKLFGTKAERDLKELTPYVGKINAEYALLASLTNDQLRAESEGLKAQIASELKSIDEQIGALRQQAADEPNVDKKEAIFKKIDATLQIKNGKLSIEPLIVDADDFVLESYGSIDFNQNATFQFDFYISEELSKYMVSSVEQMSYLLEEDHKIHI